MRRFYGALTSALVLLATAESIQAEASYPETVRLVRTMRADEVTLASIKGSLTGAQWTKERVACMSQVKYPIFTDAIALELAPRLTDAEVAGAIAFYRSEAGRKVSDQAYEDLKSRNADADVLRALTAQQRREFEKFAKSSAGRKLIGTQIFSGPGMATKISARVRVALEDCAYAHDVNGGAGAIQRGKACTSVPIRAPNHECSAVKELIEYSAAGLGNRTSIRTTCGNSGQVVASFRGRHDGVDFKWRDASAIEVIHPAGAQPEPQSAPSRFNIAYRQRAQSDPPAPQCWPDPLRNEAVHVELDDRELVSQPFWMSYVDDERCLLAKRIERSKIPGARHDAVVQFRKLSAAQYPFGTTQLVLFETVSGYDGKSAAIRGPGLDVDMVAGVRGFHLIGPAAEKVLGAIGTGGLQLEIVPIAGAAFHVELSPTDFDWALPPFQRCIGSGL